MYLLLLQPDGDLDEYTEQIKTMDRRMQENYLLEHAMRGDLDKITVLLRECPDLNRDCTDNMGRTPLRLAVRSQQLPVSCAVCTCCFLNKKNT